MPNLMVKDFSCIERADLDVKKLTIIIGPQSSGKSLLSKLVYFCLDIFDEMNSLEFVPYENHCATVERKFSDWFPPSAWGKKRFSIKFNAGSIEFDIVRRSTSSERVDFSASKYYEESYKSIVAVTKSAFDRINNEASEDRIHAIDLFMDIRRKERARFFGSMGDDAIQSKLYMPAGRSFYLTLGRAFEATRRNEELDPVTQEFGQWFTSLRASLERHLNTSSEESNEYDRVIAEKLLGGKLTLRKQDIYLATNDGRMLPSSVLSSGQQEFLPIWLMIRYSGRRKNHLVFIEEPEAHLFPASQSILIEFLVRHQASAFISNRRSQGMRMLVTTHSPYILAKINNLLKAGQLGTVGGEAIRNKVAEILPVDAWLFENEVRAYGICDGKAVSLIEEGGLIDSGYLDGISGSIVDEFSKLQDIELEHELWQSI